MTKRPRGRPHLLSHGRPAIAKPPSSLSSNATRSIIRKHHTLQKKLAAARSRQDTRLVEALSAQLADHGGLAKYQAASIQGQKSERGGDTSSVLVAWMTDMSLEISFGSNFMSIRDAKPPRLKLLEVGALSVDNACSRCGLFDVERIDIHSQQPGIIEQDFMQRPVPSADLVSEEERFDIVSLSLVVNYVGDPAARGEMLKRVSSFLRHGHDQKVLTMGNEPKAAPVSLLFLVLPAPCVTNSRYLDEGRFEGIMRTLGYGLLKKKLSSKLIYYLLGFSGEQAAKLRRQWKKENVRKGPKRNNFAIVVR